MAVGKYKNPMSFISLCLYRNQPINGFCFSDRHIAVTVRDLNPLKESLEKNGREYTMSKSGRRALFTRDLDMNAIEFVEDATI